MIERLYVHNFRTLENFTLNLAGHSSVLLLGKNGAGKSTVLQSLKLFQKICRGSGRVRELVSKNDFSYHRTGTPIRFEVSVRLAGNPYKYEISFEWPSNFHEARILKESLRAGEGVVYERNGSEVSLSGGASFRLDWHTAALRVINERPGERAIQDVIKFFSTMILIAPIPSVMTGFSEEPTPELKDDASNFGDSLRFLLGQKPAAYSVIDSHLKSVMPDFSAIEHAERGESGYQSLIKFEEARLERSLSVEFANLSDGEKCFFLVAYIVACNSVRNPVFCMWDEPDNHLSLSEVGQFIIELRKMAVRGGQFIATSHHPETIRSFSDDSTFVLSRKSHLDPTVIRSLSEIGYAGDLVDAIVRDEVIAADE